MTPSHLIAAATAFMSYGYDAGKEPYIPTRAETTRARRKKTSSASQRQARKNRRRAHAAGMRHAFAK